MCMHVNFVQQRSAKLVTQQYSFCSGSADQDLWVMDDNPDRSIDATEIHKRVLCSQQRPVHAGN